MEQVKKVLESKNLERYASIIERFIGENHSSMDVSGCPSQNDDRDRRL